eukprot:CAMPEP_0117742974 /NCGR_PEP_ID=MMETSP0947-20121206/5852_1 /TAXON_ID=44440 /ORGANISM="Chattonella subsalsa, Strain CCMP2191" /LENGTH=371 /DNA_ID=CAMNT_0005559573 /DNA_START=173 /DNA_END=1288 /DNA_ORIENTATION=+
MYRPPPPRGITNGVYAGSGNQLGLNNARKSSKRGSGLRPMGAQTLSGAGMMSVAGINVSNPDPAASSSDMRAGMANKIAPAKPVPFRGVNVNSRHQMKGARKLLPSSRDRSSPPTISAPKSMMNCQSAPCLRPHPCLASSSPSNGPLSPSSVGGVQGIRSQGSMLGSISGSPQGAKRPLPMKAPGKVIIKRWTGSGPPPPRPKGPPPAHVKKRPHPNSTLNSKNFMTQSQRRLSTKDCSSNRSTPAGQRLSTTGSVSLSIHGHSSPTSSQAESFDEAEASPPTSQVIGEDSMGGEWSEHFDVEAEAWYYYNSRTGEATWVCPDLSSQGDSQKSKENDIWQQFDEIQPTPMPDDDEDENMATNNMQLDLRNL